jgi:Mg2+ transporter MgtE
MRLGKNVLDKKVVDTARKKVVRVNDIELEEQGGRLQVTGVEGGIRGLLRNVRSELLAERLAGLFGVHLPREVVSWEVVEPLETELTRAKRQAVYTKLAKLHPADIADILEELNPSERAAVLAALDEETAAEAITEAEPEVQASVVQMMEPEKAADILEEMEPDEAADVLSDLPETKAEELLETMQPEEAQEVEELLEHEEDTAGGLMTTEHVAFPPTLSVAEAIQRIRDEAKEAETIYYVYVTDPRERLLGVLSLRELIQADPGQRLEQLMHPEVISVRAETGLREVAELLTKYNLLALPVVGGEGEMLGIVTVDDVLNLILPMIWKKRAVKKFI